MLRPLEKSKSIEKTNGEDTQSVLSKFKNAKSTIARWMKNKIFILICLSKGKLQMNKFKMIFCRFYLNMILYTFDLTSNLNDESLFQH